MTVLSPDIPAVPRWKRLVVISAASGAGFAVVLAVIVGGSLWYKSRPNAPKPWNTGALKATFVGIWTEGEKRTISFSYVLENRTDVDYEVQSGESIVLGFHLLQENGLSLVHDENVLRVNWPLFVPAKQRVLFNIYSGFSFVGQEEPRADATADEERNYRKAVGDFFTRKDGNWNGFVILDKINRYQIDFPKGW